MKRKSLLCLLSLTCFFFYAGAQYVNIPDSNFRKFLKEKYPSCFNAQDKLDTTCSLILDEHNMYCYERNIENLDGVQYFKILGSLFCYSNKLKTLPVLPATVNELWCNDNQITGFPSLPASLQSLYCGDNQISSFAAFPAQLRALDCRNNPSPIINNLPVNLYLLNVINCGLTQLPVLPVNLLYLACDSNELTFLPPTLPEGLKDLSCSNNNLTTLPELPINLNSLKCSGNQLTDLPFLPSTLDYFLCDDNQLTALPYLPENITTMDCSNNQIESLPELPLALYSLYCSNNKLQSIDHLPESLYILYCSYNQLKNIAALPAQINHVSCDNNDLAVLPSLPASLRGLECFANPRLYCLPTLPDTLSYLYIDSAITCLPNKPISADVVLNDSIEVDLPVCAGGSACNNRFVYIPDSAFRTHLQTMFPGCFNDKGLLDTTCSAVYYLIDLDCGDWGIKDIDGIQYFKSLGYFDCSHNQLTTIPALPASVFYLNCLDNKLTQIASLTDGIDHLDCTENPFLHCLPKLPYSLATLYIDTASIKCLPNDPVDLQVFLQNGQPVTLAYCDAPANTNGCRFYRDCVWLGGVDNSWENPNNWDCGTVPDANTDVVIYDATVIINSNVTIRSLTIAEFGNVTVNTGHKLTIIP